MLVDCALAQRGAAAWQGCWKPPLTSDGVSTPVQVLARQRLWKVNRMAAAALLGWSAGRRRARLLEYVPGAGEVLAMQAVGWRCVSVVADPQVPAPHANSFAMVVHDLCHLEKFADPEHHAAQVGLFDALNAALNHADWRAHEPALGPLWPQQRDAVVADMNGAAAFLWVALKARLRYAAGPGYADALELLMGPMDLPQGVQQAARAVSCRKDAAPHASAFLGHLHRRGLDVLATRGACPGTPV